MKASYNNALFTKQVKRLLKNHNKVFINFADKTDVIPKILTDESAEQINNDRIVFMYKYRVSSKTQEVSLSNRVQIETIHSYVYGLHNHNFENEPEVELQLLKIAKKEIIVPFGYNLTFQFNDVVELPYIKFKKDKCVYNLQKNIPSSLRRFESLVEVSHIFDITHIHISPSVLDRYTYKSLKENIEKLENNKIKILIPKYNMNNSIGHMEFIKWLHKENFSVEQIESNSYEEYLK